MNKEQNPPASSQSAELTCYALAFDVEDSAGLICAFCFKNICDESEYPNLSVTVTKNTPIAGNKLCHKCNLPYLRGQTEEAAEYIKENWA